MEEWRDIKEYEGLYQVSSYGQVKNLRTNRIVGFIVPKTENYVSVYCYLVGNGKRQRKNVARIVAETFIPNPENKPQIDHIDTDPTNNRVDNLRWVTAKENSNNPRTKVHQSNAAHKRKRRPFTIPNLWKEVYQYDKNGNLIKKWNGVRNAAEELNLHSPDITMCANNKRKSCGGYIWRWN